MNWQPISTAKEDGRLCEIKCHDRLGEYTLEGPHFLHGGAWYRFEPPTLIINKVTAWRYFSWFKEKKSK